MGVCTGVANFYNADVSYALNDALTVTSGILGLFLFGVSVMFSYTFFQYLRRSRNAKIHNMLYTTIAKFGLFQGGL